MVKNFSIDIDYVVDSEIMESDEKITTYPIYNNEGEKLDDIGNYKLPEDFDNIGICKPEFIKEMELETLIYITYFYKNKIFKRLAIIELYFYLKNESRF